MVLLTILANVAMDVDHHGRKQFAFTSNDSECARVGLAPGDVRGGLCVREVLGKAYEEVPIYVILDEHGQMLISHPRKVRRRLAPCAA